MAIDNLTIIGERINPGFRTSKELLDSENIEKLAKLAIDQVNADPNIQGIRTFMDQLAAEPRVSATAVQTVGTKGHDGFAIAVFTG